MQVLGMKEDELHGIQKKK